MFSRQPHVVSLNNNDLEREESETDVGLCSKNNDSEKEEQESCGGHNDSLSGNEERKLSEDEDDCVISAKNNSNLLRVEFSHRLCVPGGEDKEENFVHGDLITSSFSNSIFNHNNMSMLHDSTNEILRDENVTRPCSPLETDLTAPSDEYLSAVSSPTTPADRSNKLNILLTNARSLSPKIASLIDFIEEMSISAGIITESWLRDGPELENDLLDLEKGTSLKMVYKNRGRKSSKTHRYNNSKRGGGVAIVYDSTKINMKELKIERNKYELTAATGKQFNGGRIICMYAVYVPPKMRVETFNEMMEVIVDSISSVKIKHPDAVIIIGGDMNRRDFTSLCGAFPDIQTATTAPTRGANCLDLLATNIQDSEIGNNVFPPLETEDGLKKSDHNIVVSSYALGLKKQTSWIKYQAREKTDKGRNLFARLLVEQDWHSIYCATTSSETAAALDAILLELMDKCFPLRTYRVKSDNPPWMTHGILQMIDKRKNVFNTDQKRTPRWKHLKALTNKMIKEKKTGIHRFNERKGPGIK